VTQFASTLYPQTNPTNPILLQFHRFRVDEYFTRPRLAVLILRIFDDLPVVKEATTAQQAHARRVLTRLAKFTG
jgi:hypothetical protein